MGETCSPSCHPEDNHHDVHHHPAVANGDHSNQAQLQEVQGQWGGGVQVQCKQPFTGDAVTVMLVSVKEKPSTDHYKITVS